MQCSGGVQNKIRASVLEIDERLWGVCLVFSATHKHTDYEEFHLAKGNRAKADNRDVLR